MHPRVNGFPESYFSHVKVICLVPDWLSSHVCASEAVTLTETDAEPNTTSASIVLLTSVAMLLVISFL